MTGPQTLRQLSFRDNQCSFCYFRFKKSAPPSQAPLARSRAAQHYGIITTAESGTRNAAVRNRAAARPHQGPVPRPSLSATPKQRDWPLPRRSSHHTRTGARAPALSLLLRPAGRHHSPSPPASAPTSGARQHSASCR